MGPPPTQPVHPLLHPVSPSHSARPPSTSPRLPLPLSPSTLYFIPSPPRTQPVHPLLHPVSPSHSARPPSTSPRLPLALSPSPPPSSRLPRSARLLRFQGEG